MKFNALLLMDMWNDDWARRVGAAQNRQFIARVLDFVDSLQFDVVLFCDSNVPMHPWLLSAYPQAIGVNTVAEVNRVLKPHASILMGGSAWQGCLHKNPINFASLATSPEPDWVGGYNVFSTPHIVDSHHLSPRVITHQNFKEDSLPWRPIFDYWLLAAGSIHPGVGGSFAQVA